AVEKATPADRAAFLDEACAGDSALRQRVQDLLEAHDDPSSFLGSPAVEPAVEELEQTGTEPGRADKDALPLDFLSPSQKSDSLGGLGNYEVLEVVGRGGFSTVFKALDEKLYRVVAIKVLAPGLAASGTARRRFVREAQAAAAVKDDHVVAIYAVEEE